MKTSMLLMVRYDGLAVIPVERVCEDYFQHLSADKFIRKVDAGEIDNPARRLGERASVVVVAAALRADQTERRQVQGLEMAAHRGQLTPAPSIGDDT